MQPNWTTKTFISLPLFLISAIFGGSSATSKFFNCLSIGRKSWTFRSSLVSRSRWLTLPNRNMTTRNNRSGKTDFCRHNLVLLFEKNNSMNRLYYDLVAISCVVKLSIKDVEQIACYTIDIRQAMRLSDLHVSV